MKYPSALKSFDRVAAGHSHAHRDDRRTAFYATVDKEPGKFTRQAKLRDPRTGLRVVRLPQLVLEYSGILVLTNGMPRHKGS